MSSGFSLSPCTTGALPLAGARIASAQAARTPSVVGWAAVGLVVIVVAEEIHTPGIKRSVRQAHFLSLPLLPLIKSLGRFSSRRRE